MRVKLLGVIKILIGLIFILAGLIVAQPLVQQNIGNSYMLIGIVAGLIVFGVYGLYAVYSGWTEFKKLSKIKKRIIWAGVVGSLFMCIVMLWVINNDASNIMGSGGYIMLALILMIGVRDGYKIHKLRTATE
jgi:amino acid transporter